MILPDFVVKYAAEKVGICLAGSIGGATALLAVTTAIAELDSDDSYCQKSTHQYIQSQERNAV